MDAQSADDRLPQGAQYRRRSSRAGFTRLPCPGCVAGWDALRRRFGTKPFSELLASAVFYAENGFPLPEIGARSWITRALLNQPGYKETYMPGGVRPQLGDVFKNPALAESLRQVAAKGRDGYYKGGMAANLVKFLQAQGGAHTLEDFAEFEPEWVEPISTTYRGWQVYELPPNGQGVAALSMLNIMENFPLQGLRPQLRGGAARHDRGEEAGLCRYGALCRRPALRRRCRSRRCSRRTSPRPAPG